MRSDRVPVTLFAVTEGLTRALLVRSPTGGRDTPLLGVTHDSARVLPGWVFCCVRGERSDGHQFAAQAIENGAVALLVDHELPIDAPQIIVEDTRLEMGVVASIVHGNPSAELQVVGVTGTNGKTTVVTLVSQLLNAVGIAAEAIGTLTGSRTTPESTELSLQLRAFADAGVKVVALEVSSHALVLHRLNGIRFAEVVFTNLGQDHLDFHGSPEAYFAAKALLFDERYSHSGLVNLDDVHGRLLRDAATIDITGYSLENCADLSIGADGSKFVWRNHQVTTPLIGRFNVSNALAAAEVCVALGANPQAIAVALGNVTAPSGRFERVALEGGPICVVDYAHTPDALSNVLSTAREVCGEGRLIVVFGCGGDRDVTKRPKMGAVASELADLVIVTSDNPRSESPQSIIDSILAGCTGSPQVQPERREAIRSALEQAQSGDLVVIAGKGHETSQITGATVHAFDDRLVVAEEYAALANQHHGRLFEDPT